MLIARLFKTTKLTVADGIYSKDWASFWELYLLAKGLPLMLGLGMGILLASFIVNGVWPLVFIVLLLVPMVILFSTYPYAALIIWLLLMPFLQTTPNSAFRHIFWIVHRAMPPVALVVVVLADLIKVTKRKRVQLGRAELAMVVFVGLTLGNILWLQTSPESYLYNLYDTVFVPICLYLFIRFIAPRERELKQLIPVAFVIVLAEVIIGVLSWFAPQLLQPDWLGYQGVRTVGTLAYPHAYSTTLVFFTFLLFHDAMNRKPGVIRSVFLCVFGMGVIGVFFSFSRGSWLGALVAVTGLLVLYPKTIIRMVVILMVLTVVLGSTVFSDQITYANERMDSENTANDRWVIWDAGLQMIKAKPLFGWGYEDYSLYAGLFQRRVHNYVTANPHASHNSYIAIAAELGLPSLFLFMFPVLWWLILTLKIWPHIPKDGFWNRSLLLVFWMVILDHIGTNFFSDMRHSTYGMGIWWITLGLIANMVDFYLPSMIQDRHSGPGAPVGSSALT